MDLSCAQNTYDFNCVIKFHRKSPLQERKTNISDIQALTAASSFSCLHVSDNFQMLIFVVTHLSLFTHFPTFLIFHITNISLSSKKDTKLLQEIRSLPSTLCVYFVNGMYSYCVEAHY